MNHEHQWRLIESRTLHGVEPKTVIRRWMCNLCDAIKETEHQQRDKS